MILRRLNEHVRAQNWVAVGLDFLIVVAGVYLGIALGDWHDAREAAEEERAILGRLSAEFVVIESELDELFDRSAKAEEKIGVLIEAIDSNDLAGAFGHLSSLWEATFQPPVSATYIELRNEGGLSKIREDGIRTALTEYATVVERNEPWYELYVDFFGIDAILVQAQFSYTVEGEEVAYFFAGEEVADEEALRRFRTLTTAVAYQQTAQRVQSLTLGAARDAARTVRSEIDAVRE